MLQFNLIKFTLKVKSDLEMKGADLFIRERYELLLRYFPQKNLKLAFYILMMS